MEFYITTGFGEAMAPFKLIEAHPFQGGLQGNREVQVYWIVVLALFIQKMYQVDHTMTIPSAIQQYYRTMPDFKFVYDKDIVPMPSTKDTPVHTVSVNIQ